MSVLKSFFDIKKICLSAIQVHELQKKTFLLLAFVKFPLFGTLGIQDLAIVKLHGKNIVISFNIESVADQ